MSTTSPHLGLKVPDGSDPFLRTDFVQNYSTIDNYPGNWICTSSTRPVWGAAQTGMCITETDTRRTMMWSGTTWHEMLYGPAMWWGSLRPLTRIGASTYLSYVVGTFTVNRPGTILTIGDVEISYPTTGYVAINARAMIDGAQANWDGAGEYARSGFGGTPNNSDTLATTIPILGVRAVSPGTHSIGFAISTQSTTGTPTNTTLGIQSCRQMALFVNGDDR